MDVPCCVICLDEPNDDAPLLLLACGCRIGWFHEPCEHQWIHSQRDMPYACPACRRPVPMITNYSFSYHAGDEQKYLAHTLLLTSFSLVYFSTVSFIQYKYLFTLPLQQVLILTFPFLRKSWHDLTYFLFHARVHLCVTSFCYWMALLDRPGSSLFVSTVFVGYLHLLAIYLVHIVEWQNHAPFRRDPFLPYAISREVLHVELITKTTTDAREGNKSSRVGKPTRRSRRS
jgi:hypothetical protein